MSKPSDQLRAAMQSDPRSLNELARQSGVDVATLSRFGNHVGGLSMPAADALAIVLGLDYAPAKPKRKAAKGSTKPKGR
jgi:predicted transcriptional regulator